MLTCRVINNSFLSLIGRVIWNSLLLHTGRMICNWLLLVIDRLICNTLLPMIYIVLFFTDRLICISPPLHDTGGSDMYLLLLPMISNSLLLLTGQQRSQQQRPGATRRGRCRHGVTPGGGTRKPLVHCEIFVKIDYNSLPIKLIFTYLKSGLEFLQNYQ